ncbi:NTP transferase domain-containing protein [Streptomyces sp. NBC_00102]|uniref:NTP transferase domain-containing protein n=1 Tax=Streptomyces sp. NBC_00102 TaxID=2975652 RepID=UPI002256328B|nr:NTP transferase domain-containing protein [Streptomyces sp. NBC_00102]MCX5398339.1 NTP transferase domain-containing protein [Streptomyces sp. NBC_00102]
MTAYDAIVLAGGAARRLGGADKPGIGVGGRTLLDRVLAACAGAGATVVVGPRRATVRPVTWARESPAGGGPVAALGAGVREAGAPWIVVLSADLPFLSAATVAALLAAAEEGGREGALCVDPDGRRQPLVAVYRAEPLRRELALLATEHGTLAGLPLRLLTAELDLATLATPEFASFDCDTWDDIRLARTHIREHEAVLDEWITAVKTELGLELDVDTDVVLDLARDAAHGVARPAAPLTTFLVGYAAGLASAAAGPGDAPVAVAESARKAAALALRWEEAPGEGKGAGAS